MERRSFMKAGLLAPALFAAGAKEAMAAEPPAQDDRSFTRDLLVKIATPVLSNMARGQLQKNMQVELSPI